MNTQRIVLPISLATSLCWIMGCYFVLLTVHVSAQEENTQQENTQQETRSYNFYRAEEHWYMLELKADLWRYNPEVARGAGMDSFFTVAGYGVNDSPAALMSLVSYKQRPEITLQDYVASEQGTIQNANPDLQYDVLDWEIENRHGHTIELRRIGSTDGVVQQYAAYIDGKQDYFIALFLQFYEDEPFYANQFGTILRNIHLLPYSLKLE